MKWYEWLLVVVLIVLSNIATLLYVKNQVKTVDIVALVDAEKVRTFEDVLKGRKDPGQASRFLDLYTSALQKALSRQTGLVLVKQAVLNGGRDITADVQKKVLEEIGEQITKTEKNKQEKAH